MSANQNPDDPDLSFVTSPALRQLVELARTQPVPVTVPIRSSDVDALHAAFLVARQARRRRISGYVTLAIAAALAALVLIQLDVFRVERGMSVRTGPLDHVAEDMHAEPAAVPYAPPATAVATLSAAARIVPDTAATPSPTVLGTWEVALAPGRYNVEVDEHPGADALLLRAHDGTLELHHGRVLMIVGAAHTEVALQHGVGVWVAPDGRRETLDPSPDTTLTPPEGPAAPDVSALARRAEELLTSGKRDAAIKQLSQIVTTYPQHPAARGALLDLAPLLGAAGRTDESRCAYRLYLARYPGKAQLADQVEKALARLGEGKSCRGLKPG